MPDRPNVPAIPPREPKPVRCKECGQPDASGHAVYGMKCPKCWEPIPSLDDKSEANIG
jgi:phage FluMu protein Com